MGSYRPRSFLLGGLLLVGGALPGGCRAPKPPAPPAPPPEPGARVETTKQDVQITPWELVFSGVRGAPSSSSSVNVRNAGQAQLDLSRLEIVGENASTYRIETAPPLPHRLAPRRYANVAVAFAPPADAAPGVHRATLRVFFGDADVGLPIDLVGLVAKGKQGDNEPPLHDILEALGFGIDVGTDGLKLPADAAPVGDEIRAQLFVRAKPSPVALYPLARFSPDGTVPFGYYEPDGARPKLHPIATIAEGQEQTLNPDLEPDGKTSFDAGDGPFGLFATQGKVTLFSEDAHNTGPVRHAMRIFPLKTRAGQPVPDAFLIACEEAANADYQDFVFVLYNAKIVKSAPAPGAP